MSWSRRRLLVAAALGPLALLGAGCGFEPVYGRRAATRAPELAAVRVLPISDRFGQEVRNHLITALGGGRGAQRYELAISLAESETELSVQADDKVTRLKFALSAQLALSDSATGALLYEDQARSVSSYNIVDSEFATVASRDDARRRAAADLADSIRDLLVVYFSRPPAEAAPS
jgi:LPS-assembly lipoprotein